MSVECLVLSVEHGLVSFSLVVILVEDIKSFLNLHLLINIQRIRNEAEKKRLLFIYCRSDFYIRTNLSGNNNFVPG